MIGGPEPQLNEDQSRAVDMALNVAHSAGHMALIGPAGTGKTTTIRAIANALYQVNRFRRSVLLLAPTHKARLQLKSSRLPRGVDAWTVAKFCGLRPKQWRDEDTFKMSGSLLKMIECIGEKYCFLIVDESSMIPPELARCIVEAAEHAHIGVMFAGDPYQLPPVNSSCKQCEDFIDILPEIEHRMAPEFVDAPRIARLNRVMRHGGPILSFATHIRENWENLHQFPLSPCSDPESEIKLSRSFSDDFRDNFSRVYKESQGRPFDSVEYLYRKAPRALCHQNRTVAQITQSLRQSIYGEEFTNQWQPGELISFPFYTKTNNGVIHSGVDAIVCESKIVDINLSADFKYRTFTRQDLKILNLSFSGQFQRLVVVPMEPDGTRSRWGEHTLYAPLCGDDDPHERYRREIKERIASRRISGNHSSYVWAKEQVREIYLNRIHSSFVMTIHKSQGSTFEHVYVSRDLLYVDPEEREERNALLYVATTRASKSITFDTGKHE